MIEPYKKLETVIKPEMLSRHLRYAIMLGGAGILILLISTYFIPKKELTFIGPLICLAWIFLVISSTKPYAKLKKINHTPDELIIRKSTLIYRGKLIHFNRIKKIAYIDKPEDYGLRFDMTSGSTLFLPYFNKEAYEELKKHLSSESAGPI